MSESLSDLNKIILAYAMSGKSQALLIQSSITVEYFQQEYRTFYKLFFKCFDKFKELPTARVMEEQSGKSWNEKMANTYAEVIEISPDSRELPADLEKLKFRYNENLILKFGNDIFVNNYDQESNRIKDLEIANAAFKKINLNLESIYKSKIFDEGSLSETAGDRWNNYKFIKENPDSAKGIHLGFAEFDRITNGMQESELLLIGGESGAGKSALAMNMGINAFLGNNVVPRDVKDFKPHFDDSGSNIIYFTIEMPFKALSRRVDSCIADIPLYGIRDGKLTAEEESRYMAALKFQKHYNKHFHIVDIPRGCTMSQIESKYLAKCHEFKPDLIIIDYISLMTPERDQGQDWLNLGSLAEQMHEFLRTYKVRGISPVQLNRPEKGSNASPNQHRVGRSSMLPQNCNVLLNIESRQDEYLKRDMIIRIAKMRDGEQGSFVLTKRLEHMRLYDDVPGFTPEMYNKVEKDGYQNS